MIILPPTRAGIIAGLMPLRGSRSGRWASARYRRTPPAGSLIRVSWAHRRRMLSDHTLLGHNDPGLLLRVRSMRSSGRQRHAA